MFSKRNFPQFSSDILPTDLDQVMNALPKTHQPLVSQQNHYLIDGLKINRTVKYQL